jgi:hypothetical protein
MTVPLNFTYISLSLSNSTISANSNYIFTITFFTKHYTGDQLIIFIPSQISILNSVCTINYGLTSILCNKNSQTLRIVMEFTSFPINYTISFTLSNVVNDWLPINYNISLSSLTNDSSTYYVENSTLNVTYSSGFIGVDSVSNNKIKLLSNSILQITINPIANLFNSYGGSFSLIVNLPSTSFSAINNCNSSIGICNYINQSNGYNISTFMQFQNPISINL